MKKDLKNKMQMLKKKIEVNFLLIFEVWVLAECSGFPS